MKLIALGQGITGKICDIVRREGYVVEQPYVFRVEDEEISGNRKVLKFCVDESGTTTLQCLRKYVEQGCSAEVDFDELSEVFTLRVNLV